MGVGRGGKSANRARRGAEGELLLRANTAMGTALPTAAAPGASRENTRVRRPSHVLEEAAVWDVVLSAGGRGVGGWGRRRSVRAGGRRTRARPAGPPQAGTCTLHPLPMPPRARGHPAYHWANTRVGGQPSPCQPQVITPQICSTHIELGQEVSACTRGRAGRTSVCLPERCRHCSKCSSPRRSFGACSAGAWVGQTPPAAACPPLSPELTVDELDAQVVVPR